MNHKKRHVILSLTLLMPLVLYGGKKSRKRYYHTLETFEQNQAARTAQEQEPNSPTNVVDATREPASPTHLIDANPYHITFTTDPLSKEEEKNILEEFGPYQEAQTPYASTTSSQEEEWETDSQSPEEKEREEQHKKIAATALAQLNAQIKEEPTQVNHNDDEELIIPSDFFDKPRPQPKKPVWQKNINNSELERRIKDARSKIDPAGAQVNHFAPFITMNVNNTYTTEFDENGKEIIPKPKSWNAEIQRLIQQELDAAQNTESYDKLVNPITNQFTHHLLAKIIFGKKSSLTIAPNANIIKELLQTHFDTDSDAQNALREKITELLQTNQLPGTSITIPQQPAVKDENNLTEEEKQKLLSYYSELKTIRAETRTKKDELFDLTQASGTSPATKALRIKRAQQFQENREKIVKIMEKLEENQQLGLASSRGWSRTLAAWNPFGS